MPASPRRTRILLAAAAVLLGLLALSGADPYDRLTWAAEVAPVVIVMAVLFATWRRFPLTDLLYCLIFVHALVLLVGGAYTYARVPLGFLIADLLDMSRNPYDKIGHFFQGLVPAIAAREVLIRGDFVRRGKMLSFIVLCIVLAVSASYEFVEWGAALLLGQGAEEFLGTQGYVWDTQSDMFYALIGGCAALGLLSRFHDRQMARLQGSTGPVRQMSRQ